METTLKTFKEAELLSHSNQKRGIKKILCSDNNSVVVTTDGDCYIFGSFLYGLTSKNLDLMYVPVQLKGNKVKHIALGANHVNLLTTKQEVYSWGRNREGQIGLRTTNNLVKAPKLIEEFQNKNIIKVYACDNYSATLSSQGELYIYGDLAFLENSKYSYYQLEPKKVDWGFIVKVCCSPCHIVFLVLEGKTLIIKSVGSGMYGILGNGNEKEEDCYEPDYVEIKNVNTLNNYVKEDKVPISLKCSRTCSTALIKDKENGTSKLYVWGLCSRSFFNAKEIEKITKEVDYKNRNVQDDSLIKNRPHLVTLFENLKKIAISDTVFFMINSKQELKYFGSFFNLKNDPNKSKIVLTGEYREVAVGIDHAIAISVNNKLSSWGFNIMNKLGFPNENENVEKELNLKDINQFYVMTPQYVTEINKLMETKEKDKKQNKEEIQEESEKNLSNEIICKTPPLSPAKSLKLNNKFQNENINVTIKSDTNSYSNIYNHVQGIVKKDYQLIEEELSLNENKFKKNLKDILGKYQFLMNNEKEAKNLQQVLNNEFYFKIIDPPLNIQIAKHKLYKYPKEYTKYKKNYKALLTTLQMHPCYILNIYKNKLLTDKELYQIIKQLFFNIRDDKYSQLTLINICKLIFEFDINEFIKNKKDNIFESFSIFELKNKELVPNLFARLSKLFFRIQLKMNQMQDALASFLINSIYSKIGSKTNSKEVERIMTIKFPFKPSAEEDFNNIYSAIISGRIDLLFTIINDFIKLLATDSKDMEQFKDSLFSIKKEKYSSYGDDDNDKEKSKVDNDKKKTLNTDGDGKYIQLPNICHLYLNEISNTFLKLIEKSDTEKINNWISKNFSLIIFDKLIKTLEDPYNSLALESSIVVEKIAFTNFMKKNYTNFYSLSYALKFILTYNLVGGEFSEDDISKKIVKKIVDINTSLSSALRRITLKNSNKINFRFDQLILKEFFSHSLNDSSKLINFSLFYLKRLQEVIVFNIKDIRVLNEGFDLMDIIFFNKNADYYIGEENGLIKLEDLNKDEDDIIVQVNLKTRVLGYQNPDSVMRCRSCKTIMLNEFNINNEMEFFQEFQFFDKNSKENCVISILQQVPQANNDKITLFFKELFKASNTTSTTNDGLSEVKDLLYYFFTLVAVEQKKELLLQENDIADGEKLLQIMLNENITNSIFSNFCKQILSKYEDMNNHKEYQDDLNKTLDQIMELKDNNIIFKKDLYSRMKKNIEKGYGNPEMIKYINSLDNSSKIVRLIKHLNSLPKSKDLYEKLPRNKKALLLPYKEYNIKKLLSDQILARVLLSGYDIDKK